MAHVELLACKESNLEGSTI